MAAGKKSDLQTIWMVSREYDGLAGAGGVKDVSRQLAESLAGDSRRKVRVVLPRYGFMKPKQLGFSPFRLPAMPFSSRPDSPEASSFDIEMNYAGEDRRETVSVWQAEKKGVVVYLVEAVRFVEKLNVYTYTAQEERQHAWQRQGTGHFDYFAMNILLQKTALALMIITEERPDVIHCQDGHAAVLPAMIREIEGYRHYFRRTGAVVTIHNAGIGYHQEVRDLHFARAVTGLPEQVVKASLLGRDFDPFLAASAYAEFNTVSEGYACELQQTVEDERTGWLGHHLLQRGVTLAGITNGINPADFDPVRGEELGLPAAFDVLKDRMAGKKTCKEQLLKLLGSRRKPARVVRHGQLSMLPDQPLFTFIGRLTAQKGVDLLITAFEDLLREDPDFQLVVLGSGTPVMEARLTEIAESEEFAGRVSFLRGYDQDLALQLYAAGDFFVIPSLYEPCGLTDYIAQLLGNLPIVHHVGGLVKVVDGETGFAYRGHSPAALLATVRRALALFRDDPCEIRRMQQQAVRRIHAQHTWQKVMTRYLELYERSRRTAGTMRMRPTADSSATGYGKHLV